MPFQVGHKGKITRVDRDWSYCYVLQDDTGKDVGYLYSLLDAGGTSASPSDDKLAVGDYMCWVGEQASAAGMRVTGGSTYESAAWAGLIGPTLFVATFTLEDATARRR